MWRCGGVAGIFTAKAPRTRRTPRKRQDSFFLNFLGALCVLCALAVKTPFTDHLFERSAPARAASGSSAGRRRHADPRTHRSRHLVGGGFAAEVAGVQRGIGGDVLDRLHHALRSLRLAEVLEQRHADQWVPIGFTWPRPMMSEAELASIDSMMDRAADANPGSPGVQQPTSVRVMGGPVLGAAGRAAVDAARHLCALGE